jgi:hypothetical protein
MEAFLSTSSPPRRSGMSWLVPSHTESCSLLYWGRGFQLYLPPPIERNCKPAPSYLVFNQPLNAEARLVEPPTDRLQFTKYSPHREIEFLSE